MMKKNHLKLNANQTIKLINIVVVVAKLNVGMSTFFDLVNCYGRGGDYGYRCDGGGDDNDGFREGL